MGRSIVTLTLAGALLIGWAIPAAAQQGIVIQNNGVDSADSATGADNVNISYNPGNAGTSSGGGANNTIGAPARERDRKDRGARNNAEAAPAEEYVAPAEEYVAPAEGDYQAYTEGGEYVAPEPVAADSSAQQVLQLPSTGVGNMSSIPLAAAAGIAALAFAATGLRRRQVG